MHHHVNGIEALLVAFQLLHQRLGDLGVHPRPNVNHLVVPFVVGNQAHQIIIPYVVYLTGRTVDEFGFGIGYLHIIQADGQATTEGHLEAEFLYLVQELRGARHPYSLENLPDNQLQFLLGQQFIDKTDFFRHCLVKQHPPGHSVNQFRFQFALFIAHFCTNLDISVFGKNAFVDGNRHFLIGIKHFAFARNRVFGGVLAAFGHVIQTQYHVLRRHGDWCPVGRVQDIVRGKHQQRCFQNRFLSQWNVYGHLVTVKIGIERRSYQWVQLDSLAFNQFGLECLNAQPVQCRRAVQHDRVAFEHIFKNVPNHGVFPIHDFLSRLHGFDNAAFNQFPDDERLEQLSRHVFWQSAFVQFQFRANHNNRTAGIIHPFAEQVLAETALLAFQHIRKRLQGAVAFRTHGIHLARIVEQRINGFLQHPLFVAQNDFRSLYFNQTLQAVVADDHAAVQVVQVGSRKTATVQWHQWPQFGRYHGHHLDNHPFRAVFNARVRIAQGFHHLQAFQGLGLPLL